MSAPQPFTHLRVVDLTRHVAGPYCTKLLAGFGAEVIKVEEPGTGDPMRRQGPFAPTRSASDPPVSLPFLWLNGGKRGVTLDLEAGEGRDLLRRLLQRADILVEDFPPGWMEARGLGDENLASLNAALIRTSITPFGDSGPYRDWRATGETLYALAGGMVATGDPDRAPLAAGVRIVELSGGLHAYMGTLMALHRRESSGRGERVEVSLQESALENVEVHLIEHLHAGKTARRTGDRHAMVPWQCYPCRDGWAAVIGGPIRRWWPSLELFGESGLRDPRLRDMGGRIRHRAEVESLLAGWLAQRGREEVFHLGQARGLAFGQLATTEEALHSEQHRARGFFRPVGHGPAGTLQTPGPPFLLDEGAWKDATAPALGADNEAVFDALLRGVS